MLPKISHPINYFTIPSTGAKVGFRPMLVKEEKILLMAKSSSDPVDIFRACRQVINNCAVDDIDIDKLAMFDLEYLFLRIRAASINNIVKVSYRDGEDQKIYTFEIDLNTIEVKFPDKINKVIKINDGLGLVMKYPTVELFDDKEFFTKGDEAYYELIVHCIDQVYDNDTVYPEWSKEELEEFLDQVPINIFEEIQLFMSNIPKLYHKISYTNSLGNEREIVLNTLSDFFTLA